MKGSKHAIEKQKLGYGRHVRSKDIVRNAIGLKEPGMNTKKFWHM